MIKQIVFCDACMREKPDLETGWWQVAESAPTSLLGQEIPGAAKHLVIRPHQGDRNLYLYWEACGDECLFKLVNGYVQGVQAAGVGKCG
ncbi:MAG: hypothetical protein HY760_00465 [Nitrospirae bacterium]|nr:hypothetical protein [Nitrospirota bacterium]